MKKILLLGMLGILMFPSIVFAAADCEIPNSPKAEQLCNVVGDVAQILMGFGLTLAVIVVIIAGIRYITAGENTDQTTSARKMAINGLIGAAIMLASSFLVMMVAEFIVDKFGD